MHATPLPQPRYPDDSAEQESPSPSRDSSLLWLCCHFPRLPLEALGLEEQAACAVASAEQGRPHILVANTCAAERGVAPGQPLHAAYALCPELQIHQRDLLSEQASLQRLAKDCLGFSPWISLDYPQAMLLEVRGSLRLFGGAVALQALVHALIGDKGYRCQSAISPSPLASWLLARQGKGDIVLAKESLRSVLGTLPLTALVDDERLALRLSRSGLRSLRDLWRLPRDGLRQRFGAELLQKLDRAAGDAPEAPAFHHPPARFQARLDLERETDRLAHYFQAVAVLSGQLAAFLRSCNGAVTSLWLDLHHDGFTPSPIAIELSQPARDEAFLLRLFQERLERTRVKAPVSAVSLCSGTIRNFTPALPDLFAAGAGPATAEEWGKLLDVLRARLGREAVRRFRVHPDHRPERALTLAEQSGPRCLAPAGHRPLWFLPRAQPLQGKLQFVSGTERIEAGWWDGHGVHRDYRVARDAAGVHYWVYRELARPDHWYCHGLFG